MGLRIALRQRLYEEFHPYGTSAYRSARSGVEVSERRYRYTGKERDDETGFQIHGLRYYCPWLGRWTTSDPAGLQGGLNGFGYCRGDPVGKVDPGGTADGPFDYGVGGLVAAGVGIATSAPAPTTKFDPKVEPRIPEGRDESGDQKLVQGPERSPEIEAAKEGIVESVTSQIPASGTEYLESVGGPFNPFAQVNAAKGLVKAAETALSGSSVERSRLGGFILGSLALGAVAGKLFGGGPGAASGEAPPKLGPETGPAKAATTAGPRGRAALDPALKAEIDSALTEANKGTTTLHHGGVLRGGKVQGGRTFSTTPDLEHAQKFAEMHGGGVTSFEVPNDWLRNQLSPSVRGATEMTDFLESTGRPAPEIRFTSKVAPQLNAFRVKDR